MRLLRISLICLALLSVMSGISSAQDRYLKCGLESESQVDHVVMSDFSIEPGGIAWIPFSITNFDNPATAGNALEAFNIILKYDTTFLTPLVDSVFPFVQFEVVGRLKTAIEAAQVPVNEHFIVQHSLNPADSGSIIIGFNIGFSQDLVTIPPGTGPVFKIPFQVNPGIVDGQTTSFLFWKINECVFIPPDIDFCADCRRSQFANSFISSILPSDSLPPPALDTVYGVSVVFPSMQTGILTVDINPPPNITSFFLDSATINVGGVTKLNWDVINADSLHITGPSLDVIRTDLTDPSSMIVTAPSSEGIARYFGEAWNATDTVFSNTSMLVQKKDSVIVIPGNSSPTIAVGSAFTTEVGQPVSFLVTASDLDPADVITLSARQPLPNNASFASAVGSGSVSSTFSWTPDIGQEGTFTVFFQANDTKVTTEVGVSIVVTALQIDRLFSTSAEGEAPVGGLAGKNVVLLPINLITAQTVYGVQFDFAYDPILFDVDSFTVTGRTPDYVVYDNIGQTPGLIKVLTFGLANEPVVLDTTSAILYVSMSIDSTATPGDYPIYITDGWESIDPNPSFPSLELATDSGIIQVDLPGDVNLDKKIDVADLVNIVAYVIGTFPFPERQFEVADVITNDTVNVFDLVAVINLIFGIPLLPTSGQPIYDEWATVELDYPAMSAGQSDELIIRSKIPTDIAGVEIVIEYDPAVVALGDPSLTDDNGSFAMRFEDNHSGRLVAIMNFRNPGRSELLIAAGDVELLNIPIIAREELEVDNEQQLRITRAYLSTSNSTAVPVEGLYVPLPSTFVLKQNYPNPFNPITTIEFTLGVNSDGSATKHVSLDIFNILGRHVKSLADENMIPGHYQIEWDATNEAGQKIATGIYLYRLKVGDEMKTKKMLLLK